MKKTNRFSSFVASIFATITLASCGGSNNTLNIVVPANPQAYLAKPTYVQGSDELLAFNEINTFRNSMGLGYWQQNVFMDTIAKNHMAYSIANGGIFEQDLEVTGHTGFTGITPSARAIHVGYFVLLNMINANNVPNAAVGELYATGTGSGVTQSMINTIYHRSGLMTQNTRVMGMARDTPGPANGGTHWWFNHGRLDVGQSTASNYVAVYPINQQLNVPRSMTPESPSVYSNQPGFNFATQTSSPISITTNSVTNLTINSFTVTKAGSTTPLTGTIWTRDNDPNLDILNASKDPNALTTTPTPVPTISSYEAYWVGNAPFEANTTYNVSVTGSTYLTSYGVVTNVAQTWSFTTGS